MADGSLSVSDFIDFRNNSARQSSGLLDSRAGIAYTTRKHSGLSLVGLCAKKNGIDSYTVTTGLLQNTPIKKPHRPSRKGLADVVFCVRIKLL